jgi:hypothetical protein
MKWFKHVSTSLDDPFICELIYQFGPEAYLVFFGTLEIYAREFSSENGWKFGGNLRYFRQKFQLSNAKIKNILTKIYKWEVTIEGDRISIFIPKFKELIDNYTRNEKINTGNNLASNLQVTCTPLKSKDKRIKNKDIHIGKSPRNVFKEPTIQEIITYCKERNNSINPQTFIDHYTGNGWMVGKNKMKDWKAVIRTWETRGGNNGQTNRTGTTPPPIITKEYVPEPYEKPSDDQIERNLKRTKEIIGKLAG